MKKISAVIWDLSKATLNILAAPPSSEKPPVAVKNPKSTFVSWTHIVRLDSTGRPIPDPSFDVEWIVSGSKDRHVIFWDAKDAAQGKLGSESQPLLTMTGHKNSGL